MTKVRYKADTAEQAAKQWFSGKTSAGYRTLSLFPFPAPTGGVAFWELRAEHPTAEKITRPLFEAEAGVYELARPDAEFLPFNALEATEQPARGIIWVEGPKKAHAVTQLGCLGLTSGNATSAGPKSKCDFSVLKGRRVLFWPDNDIAGYQHVWEVYERASTAEALFVDVEAVPALAKKSSDVVDAIKAGAFKGREDIGKLPVLKPDEFRAKYFPAIEAREEEKASKNYDPGEHYQIARDFLEDIQGELAYTDGGLFWRWDSRGYWRCLPSEHEILRDIIRFCLKAKYGVGSSGKPKSILELLKHQTHKQLQVGTDEMVINCLSGELHWTGSAWELRKHDREAFRTNIIPHHFDPSARPELFTSVMMQIFDSAVAERFFDDAALTDAVYEGFGYTLLPTSRFERAFWLAGEGATGKSTVLEALMAMLGGEHFGNFSTLSISSIEERFLRFELVGKLANIATEISAGEEIPDGIFKSLVSGEPITVERKYQHPFQFRNQATLWFASNHAPNLNDRTNAFARRLTVIPFVRSFAAVADVNLKQRLREDAGAIFCEAVRAAGELLKRGKLLSPEAVEEAKEDVLAESDPVRAFIRDEYERAPEFGMPASDLYEHYKEWCDDQGFAPGMRATKQRFSKRVYALGFEKLRERDSRIVGGLRPVEDRWRTYAKRL